MPANGIGNGVGPGAEDEITLPYVAHSGVLHAQLEAATRMHLSMAEARFNYRRIVDEWNAWFNSANISFVQDEIVVDGAFGSSNAEPPGIAPIPEIPWFRITEESAPPSIAWSALSPSDGTWIDLAVPPRKLDSKALFAQHRSTNSTPLP